MVVLYTLQLLRMFLTERKRHELVAIFVRRFSHVEKGAKLSFANFMKRV